MFENFLYLSEEQINMEGGMIHVAEDNKDENFSDLETAPLLALKNTVLFPGIVIPITVGRNKSIKAINKCHKDQAPIGVLSQKSQEIDEPSEMDLFRIGTLARVIKIIKMPDGSITAILQGKSRFRLEEMIQESPYLLGKISHPPYLDPSDSLTFEATMASITDKAKKIIELSPQLPSEAIMMLKNIDSDVFLLDFIASNMNTDVHQKQSLLEINDLLIKSQEILKSLDSELHLLEVRDQIETKVRGNLEKQQRDYFLSQQLKTIQDELGQNPQANELLELRERAKAKKWPEEAKEAFEKNLERLERSNPQMADYGVTLNYVETLLELPWNKYSKDKFDLRNVQAKLDKDHFGLEKVKDRIIEHLAVLKLKGDMKSPILCLVGPPGVGKTSLGQSVADALGRKFVRMSLGGLHDESEIRGHRKTYIGAMPGRILQSLKKTKTSNPVFILDEIDKMGKDFRGDPSSALLEVLDPEQNETFHDNFLEIEYDLSKILFIATANSLNTIQQALLDRMEIIDVSGYSQEEKFEIAKRHLIPKQRKAHGLNAEQVAISNSAIEYAIQHHTRESGVRSLDRVIARMMRYAAKNIAMEKDTKVNISNKNIEEILGPKKFLFDLAEKTTIPGVAVGLAWTRVGGDILFIEASSSSGSGKLILTGNLGDVMKESATTALSYLKANAEQYGFSSLDFSKKDIHIHVPEGAIPKDGPSAGITMLTALFSSLSGKKVKSGLAMTGEITLRGRVLPVGGIKEKVLAAKRAGIRDILMSEENRRHFEEIESSYVEGLSVHYVSVVNDVLAYSFDAI